MNKSAQMISKAVNSMIANGSPVIAGIPEKYVKVRFVSGHGETAGIVISETKFNNSTISGLSRLFPVSEFRKMGSLQASPVFDSFDAAFLHQFN